MMLPDVNVLLNSIQTASPFHASAKRALERAFNSEHGICLAWVAMLGFLRIATRSGVLQQPLSVADALSLIDSWITHPNARIVHPGDRHAGILGRLLLSCGSAGNLTTDAHLASLAIEHSLEMLTFDRDFKRFAGLRFQLLN